MRRQTLLVGAFIVLVGAAASLAWMWRGADDAVATDLTMSVSATETPTATESARPGHVSSSASASEASPPTGRAGEIWDHSGTVDLRIPGIDLDVTMRADGLRDGRINPPGGTVMWFDGSERVRPGAVGTAVIAGHVASGSQPDAFADLADVEVGDRVTIRDGDGRPRVFHVVRADVVDKDALTTDQDVWGGNDSVRRLAIITCDDANGYRSDGHRVANYVVIAEPR